MDLRLVPKADCGGSDRSETLSTTSPNVVFWSFAEFSVPPTIISASSRADFSRGSQVATFLPPRRIVAVSHSVRISSSLCEIYKIEVPSAFNFRRVVNRVVTSCGVKTLVGSSMIKSFGFCNRQRMISTLWRSPAERSPTKRSGSSGKP